MTSSHHHGEGWDLHPARLGAYQTLLDVIAMKTDGTLIMLSPLDLEIADREDKESYCKLSSKDDQWESTPEQIL